MFFVDDFLREKNQKLLLSDIKNCTCINGVTKEINSTTKVTNNLEDILMLDNNYEPYQSNTKHLIRRLLNMLAARLDKGQEGMPI